MAKLLNEKSILVSKLLTLILKNPDPTRPWSEYAFVKNNVLWATNGHIALKCSNQFVFIDLAGNPTLEDGLYKWVSGNLYKPLDQPQTTYPDVSRVLDSIQPDTSTLIDFPGWLDKIKPHKNDSMPLTINHQDNTLSLYPPDYSNQNPTAIVTHHVSINATFLAPMADSRMVLFSKKHSAHSPVIFTQKNETLETANVLYIISPLKNPTQPTIITLKNGEK